MSQTDDPSAGRGDGDEGDGDTGETVVGGSVTPEGGPATDREPFTFEDVTVVMGTYNEEAAIGTVLADIERVTDGQAAVVCVDGSTDRTAEIARERGAQVIEQEPQGYGWRCGPRCSRPTGRSWSPQTVTTPTRWSNCRCFYNR